MPLPDKELLREIAKDLNECYEFAKVELGENFESIMADVAAEILDFQYKCKPGHHSQQQAWHSLFRRKGSLTQKKIVTK